MQLDREIHLALAHLAGNPLHHFFLDTVHTNFHRCHITALLPRTEGTIRRTLSELSDIVDAVCRGYPERAEALARAHVRRATEIMQAVHRRAARRPSTAKPISRPRRRSAASGGSHA
jgi:DNA-binding GntR family transcriptional regulator